MTVRDPGITLGGPDQYGPGDLEPRPFQKNYTAPYHEEIRLIQIDSLYIDPYPSGGVYVYSSYEKPSEFEFGYCRP